MVIILFFRPWGTVRRTTGGASWCLRWTLRGTSRRIHWSLGNYVQQSRYYTFDKWRRVWSTAVIALFQWEKTSWEFRPEQKTNQASYVGFLPISIAFTLRSVGRTFPNSVIKILNEGIWLQWCVVVIRILSIEIQLKSIQIVSDKAWLLCSLKYRLLYIYDVTNTIKYWIK